jgi:hypothetical protein
MAAEFYISFADPSQLVSRAEEIEKRIMTLPTFAGRRGDEFWLKGTEPRDESKSWPYDVRLIFTGHARPLLEISVHPPSIERDLASLFAWFRTTAPVSVVDEDGEPTSW